MTGVDLQPKRRLTCCQVQGTRGPGNSVEPRGKDGVREVVGVSWENEELLTACFPNQPYSFLVLQRNDPAAEAGRPRIHSTNVHRTTVPGRDTVVRRPTVGSEVPAALLTKTFLVFLQAVGPRKVLAAGGAGVGAVSGMDAHMLGQLAGLREAQAADGAGVGTLAGMDANVVLQVAGEFEGLAAGGAVVGAVAVMGAHVLRQVVGERAGLAAGGADVGVVAGMEAHVPRQAGGRREELAACGVCAGVGAFASVGAQVQRQSAGLREGHAAGSAGVWAVAAMGAHVRRQAAGLREGLAAGSAGVGAVAGMGAHVIRQVVRPREGLAAGIAGVGALAGMGAHVCSQGLGRREVPAARGALELAPLPDTPPLARRSEAFPSFHVREAVAELARCGQGGRAGEKLRGDGERRYSEHGKHERGEQWHHHDVGAGQREPETGQTQKSLAGGDGRGGARSTGIRPATVHRPPSRAAHWAIAPLTVLALLLSLPPEGGEEDKPTSIFFSRAALRVSEWREIRALLGFRSPLDWVRDLENCTHSSSFGPGVAYIPGGV